MTEITAKIKEDDNWLTIKMSTVNTSTVDKDVIDMSYMQTQILDIIKKNTISKVSFYNCRITSNREDNAAALLANFIRENNTLTILEFENTRLSSPDIELFIDALTDNKSLTKVHLTHEDNEHDVYAGPYRRGGWSIQLDLLKKIHALLETNPRITSLVYPYLDAQYCKSTPEENEWHQAISDLLSERAKTSTHTQLPVEGRRTISFFSEHQGRMDLETTPSVEEPISIFVPK